jgi:beta-phosphoglucomutase-like phosphatase (HAD superfamily)
MLTDPIDALIFDVDGTLAETEEAHRISFNEAFADAGLPWRWTRDDYRDLLKVTGGKERIAHFIAISGSPVSADLVPALHARKTELYGAHIAGGAVGFRPGIEALMAEARRRDVALAIATTTSRPNVDALLAAVLGPGALSDFRAIACGDMVKAKKPAPWRSRTAGTASARPGRRASGWWPRPASTAPPTTSRRPRS